MSARAVCLATLVTFGCVPEPDPPVGDDPSSDPFGASDAVVYDGERPGGGDARLADVPLLADVPRPATDLGALPPDAAPDVPSLAVRCDNGVPDGDETDVDCGGSCPRLCGNGAGCASDPDCETGVCRQQVCRAARCDDGVLNGDELVVDCGGACPGCEDCHPDWFEVCDFVDNDCDGRVDEWVYDEPECVDVLLPVPPLGPGDECHAVDRRPEPRSFDCTMVVDQTGIERPDLDAYELQEGTPERPTVLSRDPCGGVDGRHCVERLTLEWDAEGRIVHLRGRGGFEGTDWDQRVAYAGPEALVVRSEWWRTVAREHGWGGQRGTDRCEFVDARPSIAMSSDCFAQSGDDLAGDTCDGTLATWTYDERGRLHRLRVESSYGEGVDGNAELDPRDFWEVEGVCNLRWFHDEGRVVERCRADYEPVNVHNYYDLEGVLRMRDTIDWQTGVRTRVFYGAQCPLEAD